MEKRPWHDAVHESYTCCWEHEWDLTGPPGCVDIAKRIDDNGGDPRSWLERFEADRGIEKTDRLHHELATLADALYYAGSVDCLNLGGPLCLEIVARRLESIVEALGGWEEQASCEAAGYLAGRKPTMDCFSSQLSKRTQPQADVPFVFNPAAPDFIPGHDAHNANFSCASSQVPNEARVQSCSSHALGPTTRGDGVADNDIGDDGPTAPHGGRLPPAAGKGMKPRGRGRGGGRGKM